MEWEILYFNEDLQHAIMSLPAGIQARFIHLAGRIEIFGPNLGMPHSRAMGNGLFELRMKSREGIGRVFYGCDHASAIDYATFLGFCFAEPT
jgi:phage-related protein